MKCLGKHCVLIDRPPQDVWREVVDIKSWPVWSPTMTTIEWQDNGPFRLGSTALVKQPMQPKMEWTVTAFEPTCFFAWEARVLGAQLRAEHYVLRQGNGSRSVVTFYLAGGLTGCLRPMLRFPIGWALATENRALKKRCES